ncbi:MAG: hypothetical protein ACJA0N_001239 [Pseudohongiellaceae bacterium]|jgi:hypothetical protein
MIHAEITTPFVYDAQLKIQATYLCETPYHGTICAIRNFSY